MSRDDFVPGVVPEHHAGGVVEAVEACVRKHGAGVAAADAGVADDHDGAAAVRVEFGEAVGEFVDPHVDRVGDVSSGAGVFFAVADVEDDEVGRLFPEFMGLFVGEFLPGLGHAAQIATNGQVAQARRRPGRDCRRQQGASLAGMAARSRA